jgi:AbrB family looped-hinge helix DNA binding protein
MALSVKVSTKNQISIPSEARRRLGIEPGDRLQVEVVADALVLRRRPQRASDRMWAIGRGLYGPDPVTFVRDIRDELEENLREREALVARDPGERSSTRRA